MKALARELLPTSYQVPVKYWYNRFRGMLEDEMDIFEQLVRSNGSAIDIGDNGGIYA